MDNSNNWAGDEAVVEFELVAPVSCVRGVEQFANVRGLSFDEAFAQIMRDAKPSPN